MSAHIGHNMPPSPIDDALSPFGDDIAEAEAWLDGSPVETEGQMQAVDALTKQIKAAKKAVEAAEEAAAKPFYVAWKAEKEKFAPTLGDLDRIVKGLVAAVSAFKAKLAAEKEAARRQAEREAWEATQRAKEAAMAAAASDLEAQRQADALADAAKAAQAQASSVAADTVKGMRKVTRYEITDQRALLNYIARVDRQAIVGFIEEWARRNHKEHRGADGLHVWDDKEAF